MVKSKWSDYFSVPLIFFSVLVKSFIKILDEPLWVRPITYANSLFSLCLFMPFKVGLNYNIALTISKTSVKIIVVSH
jgi:glycopeptide antibiotics resistance protein